MPVGPVSSCYKRPDYYTNYYMKRPKFNSSGPVASWLAIPTPTKKARARETGIATRRLEIDAAQAWQGWDFRSPQTVLKTAGLASAVVHQRPLKFDC